MSSTRERADTLVYKDEQGGAVDGRLDSPPTRSDTPLSDTEPRLGSAHKRTWVAAEELLAYANGMADGLAMTLNLPRRKSHS